MPSSAEIMEKSTADDGKSSKNTHVLVRKLKIEIEVDLC